MNTSKNNISTTKSSATYSNKVLVFSSKEIQSFFKLLYNFCQNTEIEVFFIDGDEESFSSIKDLVEYIEIYKQTIYKLYFKGLDRKSKPKKFIRIEIINSHYGNFSMYIKGSRDQTKQLKQDIEKTLNSITPSLFWKWITKIEMGQFMAILLLINYLMFILINSIVNISVLKDIPMSNILNASGISMLIIMILLLFTDPLNRIKDKYFPVIIFAIGQEKKKYERMKGIVYFFGTVVLPFVVPYIIQLCF